MDVFLSNKQFEICSSILKEWQTNDPVLNNYTVPGKQGNVLRLPENPIPFDAVYLNILMFYFL